MKNIIPTNSGLKVKTIYGLRSSDCRIIYGALIYKFITDGATYYNVKYTHNLMYGSIDIISVHRDRKRCRDGKLSVLRMT